MKAIRLTYRKDENITGRIISMFFRLAGIYVTDRYIYDEGKYMSQNLKERIEELLEEREDSLKLPSQKDYQYEAEIFFLSNYDDNFILKNEIKFNRRKKVFILNYQSDSILEENYKHIIDNIDGMESINILLKKIKELQLISVDEYDDLEILREIYVEKKYFNTLMKSKYFFNSEWLYDKNCFQYNNDIQAAIKKLSENKLEEWGGTLYYHTQYAIAEMVYELNLYCRRNQKGMIYSVDGLVDVIESIDRENSEILGNHTKNLLGQVYYDLKDEANKAYDYYLECCDDDESLYNAFLFKVKGVYWQNFVCDYERANKYYLKSILIFPEYFSAWYKMGYCYYQLNNKRMALFCFETIVKILESREYSMLTPKDIEHLFLSLKQCAELVYEINAEIDSSINYAMRAEKLWNSMPYNIYLDIISDNSKEKQKLVKEVKDNLNIKEIALHLSNMYKLRNEYDKAHYYEEKYLI